MSNKLSDPAIPVATLPLDGTELTYIVQGGASKKLAGTPMIVGGNAAGSTLTLQSTGGVGTSDAIIFKTGSQVEAGRIETGGRFLITKSATGAVVSFAGTTAQLQIQGTGSGDSSLGVVRFSNSAGGTGNCLVAKSRGATIGSYTTVQDGDGLGSWSFCGSDGSALVLAASIDCFVDGSPSAGNVPGLLSFQTTPVGGGGNTVASFTLDSRANVIIGDGIAGVDGTIATTATDGFLYVETCAGTPTGTPTTHTGRVAVVFDRTNHQFWIYDGAWKQPKTPAGASIVTWQ